MNLNHYRFHSEWVVPTDPASTLDVLRDVQAYASWWPEVKSVIPVDQNRVVVLIMGVLPYSLELMMESEVDDADRGLLRARLTGDLEGYSSWTVQAEGSGSRLLYDQEVEVNKALLRRLAPIARPVFRLNHALMMARGKKGLRRHLGAAGREAAPPAA